ncbi:MAG TPA: hypothetical protein VEB18_02950 [Candidatus Paceibacterota bacterium]|nr:hypothetical protein [Candidatus Paceibacterota bacterium]
MCGWVVYPISAFRETIRGTHPAVWPMGPVIAIFGFWIAVVGAYAFYQGKVETGVASVLTYFLFGLLARTLMLFGYRTRIF